jgi:hypothetical protein
MKNVEVAVGVMEAPDVVVAHAVVHGQDQFDGVALFGEFCAESVDHIAQASGFDDWGTF